MVTHNTKLNSETRRADPNVTTEAHMPNATTEARKPGKINVVHHSKQGEYIVADSSESGLAQFDDAEERADEEIWLAKFAATPDDKLHKLVQQVRASVQAGKTRPLDFENR